jgi:hypothetical protein
MPFALIAAANTAIAAAKANAAKGTPPTVVMGVQ